MPVVSEKIDNDLLRVQIREFIYNDVVLNDYEAAKQLSAEARPN